MELVDNVHLIRIAQGLQQEDTHARRFIAINIHTTLLALQHGKTLEIWILSQHSSAQCIATHQLNADITTAEWVLLDGTETWLLFIADIDAVLYCFTPDLDNLLETCIADDEIIQEIRVCYNLGDVSRKTKQDILILMESVVILLPGDMLRLYVTRRIDTLTFSKLDCAVKYPLTIQSFDIAGGSGSLGDIQFIVGGAEPMLASFGVQDNSAGYSVAQFGWYVAKEVTSAVFSLVGSFFGKSPKNEEPPEEESKNDVVAKAQTSKVRLHHSLDEPKRVVQSFTLSPSRDYGAAVDRYGRVLLLDTQQFVIVRMWKGYRDAQCGWISNSGSKPFLVIYAPLMGLLEVWKAPLGPRIGVRNVGGNCLLSSTCFFSQKKIAARSFLIQSNFDTHEITLSDNELDLFLKPFENPLLETIQDDISELRSLMSLWNALVSKGEPVFIFNGSDEDDIREKILDVLSSLNTDSVDTFSEIVKVLYPFLFTDEIGGKVCPEFCESSLAILNIKSKEIKGSRSDRRMNSLRSLLEKFRSVVDLYIFYANELDSLEIPFRLGFDELLSCIDLQGKSFVQVKDSLQHKKILKVAIWIFSPLLELVENSSNLVTSFCSFGVFSPLSLTMFFTKWMATDEFSELLSNVDDNETSPQLNQIKDDIRELVSYFSQATSSFGSECCNFLLNLDGRYCKVGIFLAEILIGEARLHPLRSTLHEILGKLMRISEFYLDFGSLDLPISIISLESEFYLPRLHAIKLISEFTTEDEKTSDETYDQNEIVDLQTEAQSMIDSLELLLAENVDPRQVFCFMCSELLTTFEIQRIGKSLSLCLELLRENSDKDPFLSSCIAFSIFKKYLGTVLEMYIVDNIDLASDQELLIMRSEDIIRMCWTGFKNISQIEDQMEPNITTTFHNNDLLLQYLGLIDEVDVEIEEVKAGIESLLLVLRCTKLCIGYNISPEILHRMFPYYESRLDHRESFLSNEKSSSLEFCLEILKNGGPKASGLVSKTGKTLGLDMDTLRLEYITWLYSVGDDAIAEDVIPYIEDKVAVTDVIFLVTQFRLDHVIGQLLWRCRRGDSKAQKMIMALPLEAASESSAQISKEESVEPALYKLRSMLQRLISKTTSEIMRQDAVKMLNVVKILLEEVSNED